MSINRNNYEAFFLDYRENNLTPEQVAELLIFLEENPDLKEEFESFEAIQMVPDKNIRFEVKESLKKSKLIPTENIDAGNYDNYIVADLEGDLSEDDDLELKAFISLNPKTKLEYNFYRSTFLKPDKSIQFTGKDKLKKTGLLVIYRTQIVYALAVAASVIILLGVYFRFADQPEERNVIVSVEIPEVQPLNQDQKSATIDNNNPVADRNDNTVVINSEAVDIEKPENDQIRLLSENFRMAYLPRSKEIPVHHSRFIRPENRRNDKMLAVADDVVPEPEKKESFVARFIGGLAGKVIKTDNLKGKSFLDYTIDGYNLMADKNVSLEKEVDETGKVIAYSLDGENLSFFKNKNQQKE
jgi:hypothetical protein